MPNDLVAYRPIGGVNTEASEPAVPLSMCTGSLNFMFERGMVVTRPGVQTLSVAGLTGDVTYANSKRYGTTPYTVLLTSGAKIYKLVGTTPTEITGVTPTFGATNYHNVESVNGVLLIANSTGGLIRWDPTGTTATLISAAKYRYVTSHLSRAVAAYDTNASALVGPRTVGWSIAGDESNWASAGSGSSVLAEAIDDITGLGVCHNIVVILRRSGKHLGYPTGSSSTVFRFENYTRSGAGCYYEGTAAFDDNEVFYVGVDNVYKFDVLQDEAIGQNIRRELIARLRAGYNYRGFISRVSDLSPKRLYHLVCTNGSAGVPHYIYDIEEGTWSRHTYKDLVPLGGWSHIVSTSAEYVTLYAGSSLLRWSDSADLDTSAQLRSGLISIGALNQEMHTTRALIRYQDRGATELTLEAITDREARSTVVALAGQNDRRWKRVWADYRLVGQDFTMQLSTAKHLAFDYIGLSATPSGEFRNA